MRAVLIERYGGPEVLTVRELPSPVPGPGDLLVEVVAAGVNFIDIYHREGRYPLELPAILGNEGAGTVVSVGDAVTTFHPGDRVAWTGVLGSYATEAVVPATAAVRVPDDVTFPVAAAVLLQGMTAHYLCSSTYPVRAGDLTVVHAAAGGVGLLLTQMIKMRGGTVVATTSGGEKATLATGAGADYAVGYSEFADVVAAASGGRGADVVYDGVGRATFDDSLAALRPRGMLVLFGAASGPVPPFDPQRLNSGGSLFLTRPTLIHYIADRGELEWRAGELFAWIASASLDVRVGGTYRLEDVARAHDDLAARRTTGKLLLTG